MCSEMVVTLGCFCVAQEINNLQSKKTDVGELEKEREEAMERLQVSSQLARVVCCSAASSLTRNN